MIITPDFVFLQSAKTGTSTLANAIKLFYHQNLLNRPVTQKISDRILFKLGLKYPYCNALTTQGTAGKHKHLNLDQLPRYGKGLPILSGFRHPESWIQSHYKYEDWKRKINQVGLVPSNQNEIDLFLQYSKAQAARYDTQGLGFYTWAFLKQHGIQKHQIDKAALSKSLSEIHWIRTENLNDDFNRIQKGLNITKKYGRPIAISKEVNKSRKSINEEERSRLNAFTQATEPLLYEIHEMIQSQSVESIP